VAGHFARPRITRASAQLDVSSLRSARSVFTQTAGFPSPSQPLDAHAIGIVCMTTYSSTSHRLSRSWRRFTRKKATPNDDVQLGEGGRRAQR
jgi:hypothetical protein